LICITFFLLLISFTSKYSGLGFPSYPAAVPVGYMIPQVPYNNAVNYGPNGYGGGGRFQNNKVGVSRSITLVAVLHLVHLVFQHLVHL
jgi:hypothetical protein